MPEIPELVSERLRLRGWSASDADALRRIYGDPLTVRYIDGLDVDVYALARPTPV